MAELFFRGWSLAQIAATFCDRTLRGFCSTLLLLVSLPLTPRLIPVRITADRDTPRRRLR
jgi:hypothetical protein